MGAMTNINNGKITLSNILISVFLVILYRNMGTKRQNT